MTAEIKQAVVQPRLTDAEVERIIKLMDILVRRVEDAIHAKQPEPYDQTALELCNACGWKTLIPGDGCLNCERSMPATTGQAGDDWIDALELPAPSPEVVHPTDTQLLVLRHEIYQITAGDFEATLDEVAEIYVAVLATTPPAPAKSEAVPAYTATLAANPAPAEQIHSCGYYCHFPACIKAQRDELRDKLAQSIAGVEAMREAAQAVVDRWDGPQVNWVQQGPTIDLIRALGAALAAHPAPVVAAIPDELREALELVICESEAQCEVLEPGCVRCDATVLLRKYFSLFAEPTKDKS